jgi:hypothetical protein
LQSTKLRSETKTKNLPGARGELIAAHLDLTNLRWQMGFGFALACLAALTCEFFRPVDLAQADRTYLAWAAETVSSSEPLTRVAEALSTGTPSRDPFTLLTLITDCQLWQQDASGYLLTNFLIHGLVMLLVALVVLELTGLTGNRGGTTGALWAALLFAVAPYVTNATFFENSRESLIGAAFLLASVFCWLRYKLIQEKWYRSLSLICLILFFGSLALAEPALVTTKPVVIVHAKELKFLSSSQTVMFGLAAILFFVRWLRGWVTKESLFSVGCLAILADLPNLGKFAHTPHLLTCSAIALAMLLPIMTLPVMDRIDRKNALLFSAIGTCVLVITFLLWCTIFQVQPETMG